MKFPLLMSKMTKYDTTSCIFSRSFNRDGRHCRSRQRTLQKIILPKITLLSTCIATLNYILSNYKNKIKFLRVGRGNGCLKKKILPKITIYA